MSSLPQARQDAGRVCPRPHTYEAEAAVRGMPGEVTSVRRALR